MKIAPVAIALALTTSVGAADLSEQDADTVGMSAERLDRITALAHRYVDDGKLAGL